MSIIAEASGISQQSVLAIVHMMYYCTYIGGLLSYIPSHSNDMLEFQSMKLHGSKEMMTG